MSRTPPARMGSIIVNVEHGAYHRSVISHVGPSILPVVSQMSSPYVLPYRTSTLHTTLTLRSSSHNFPRPTCLSPTLKLPSHSSPDSLAHSTSSYRSACPNSSSNSASRLPGCPSVSRRPGSRARPLEGWFDPFPRHLLVVSFITTCEKQQQQANRQSPANQAHTHPLFPSLQE